MSGERAARALEERFDSICREELVRLRRKLAAFSADDRAAIEAATSHVVNAIAAGPARALARDESQVLVRTVVELFHVA